MSTVFSKNKEKRSRSSSNEANNSFVKNVTARVSGLLPATITKWFSSPSSSNANGSAQAADATDSSTEDEAPESPITTQPPSKRMRFNSPGKFNHFGQTEANCVTSNIDTLEQCTQHSTAQSAPGRSNFRRETNFISTPVRPANEESTLDQSERDTTFKPQHTVASIGTSVAKKRKSLFDSTSRSEESAKACARTASNTKSDPKAPYFKPSLFGSPFYPGQTTYGGASSTYINQPNIRQRKVALVNESKDNDNLAMSQSARRVLDLLENYSSPLMEAKRIAPYINCPRNETTANSSTTSTNSTITGSPYSQKVISYKTQELHVPSIASVLRLKQRSRLMDTTNAARQIIASHSSTAEYAPYPSSSTYTKKDHAGKETSSKLSTKIKSRLTRTERGDSMELEDQIITPVNLPTGVLQIDKDNLPKFTFGTPTSKVVTLSTPAPTFAFTSTPISKANSVAKFGDTLPSKPAFSKSETVTNSDPYKFSSPVRISSEPPQLTAAPPKFTFGSPERGIDKPKVDEKKDDNSSSVVGIPKQTEKILIPKTNDWKCPDCWVSNKPDVNKCVCCGAKQPSSNTSKPSKCSVCKVADSQLHIDKCVYCEKIQTNSYDKITATKPATSSKWKCDDCWVDNDEHVEKCVCCGAKNKKVTSGSKNTSDLPKGANTSSSDSEWKCDDCWIKNKSDADKCAACGGSRPGAKQTAAATLPANTFGSTLFKTPDSGMKNIVKKQSDTWECSSCLVRNENNRSKCICCESDKPGTIKESDKKTFNFGVNANTSFKFGIDPKPLETSTVKNIAEKPVEVMKKPEESETNNNILPKTPSFTFGIPAKKPEDQIDTAKPKTSETKTSEAVKVNFTFGISKVETTAVPVSNPIFGSANKISESVKPAEDKNKNQEVQKIDLLTPVSKESPKPITGIFGSQITTQANQDKPAASPSLLNSITNPAKEVISTPLTLKPNVTSSDGTPSQSTFTFTGMGIKPAANLFGIPAATTSTFAAPAQAPATVISAPSLFQKPETTVASTPSLFQKPETATTSTVSLFQKTETTATAAAPPPVAATAPIFSFGNSTPQIAQSSVPQPEKPKFNFTFGSNSSPMFNNTFGSSNDNSATTNKFGLGGNGLSTGGNGLSAPSPMAGGNVLATNKLGGNAELPSNPLMGGNEIQPSTNIFGTPVQKENLWSSSSSNTTNLFVTNSSSNPLQKPATFTFGSNANNSPFNANNAAPSTPFGSNTAPAPNVFGMNTNTASQPSLFAGSTQNQAVPNIFGSPQPANSAPSMGIFGAPSVAATPTFGAPNPAVPSFEAPTLAPTPTPTFNFNSSMQTPGIFGFGQSQQPQSAQPTGVYSFGATAGAPQVQFNMGSAPGGRKVRKAVRRNPQR